MKKSGAVKNQMSTKLEDYKGPLPLFDADDLADYVGSYKFVVRQVHKFLKGIYVHHGFSLGKTGRL